MNAWSTYRRACSDGGVWRRAAKVGLTVGLIQVAVNQGDHWVHHEITTGVVLKSILSPLLSFSIAFASAAGTYVETSHASPHEKI
jgi:hypothetical protein